MKTSKRFYDKVSIGPLEGGYGVFLDGRQLKTAMKNALVLPSAHLARLIAEEWDAQDETVKPHTMAVTRLVNVAIDITPGQRQSLIDEARNYASTDLLCYRADQPARLSERQAKAWDPILRWARGRGLELQTTDAITAIEQPAASLRAVEDYAAGLDDLHLTLFVHFIASFGSAVLALSVMEGFLQAEAALKLSRIDESFQAENWGVDELATAKEQALRSEILALGHILNPAG